MDKSKGTGRFAFTKKRDSDVNLSSSTLPLSTTTTSSSSSSSSSRVGGCPEHQSHGADESWKQAYIFAEADSESNIVFSATEDGLPLVKGATVLKLVERLTYPTYPDPEFVASFLLTYRTFATAREVLRLLAARFNIPTPSGLTDKALADLKRDYITPVRLRVMNVLKTWLVSHFYDFEGEQMVKDVKEFFEASVVNGGDLVMAKAGAQLLRILERQMSVSGGDQCEGKEEVKKSHMFDEPPPTPILGDLHTKDHLGNGNLGLLDVHPDEMARQMTLVECAFYMRIKSWECLNQAWTKEDKIERAPNIMAMTERFNKVSAWVVTELVTEKDDTTRVARLQRLIEVAHACCAQNNFHGGMEILSGLLTAAAHRLKHTWAVQGLFESIKTTLSSEKNYQTLRTHLRTMSGPCIPYLGMFLTDLTFIEDGTPNELPGGLINFAKRRSLAQVIREIQQFQQCPFNFEAVPAIQKILENAKPLSTDDAYKLSLEIAPRGSQPLSQKQIKEMRSRYKKLMREGRASGPRRERNEAVAEIELDIPEGYPFGQKDDPSNLVLEQREGRVVVKYATLEKLVERLTHARYSDTTLVNMFLLTYRSFVTSHDLLTLLMARFRVPLPKNKSDEVLSAWRNQTQRPIHCRVFNMCKSWITKYLYDSDAVRDEAFINRFLAFLDEMSAVDDAYLRGAAGPLKAKLTAKATQLSLQAQYSQSDTSMSEQAPQSPQSQSQPQAASAPGSSMMSFSVEELASQICLLDQELFVQIPTWEFCVQAWKKKKDRGVMPCLKISAFNARHAALTNATTTVPQLLAWIQSEIVSGKTTRERSARLGHCLKIIEARQFPTKCYVLGDLNAVATIVSALQLPAISSMTAVWAGMAPYPVEAFESMKHVVQSWSNFASFQDKLATMTPTLPYLYTYTSQLIWLEIHSSDSVAGLVNFEKWQAMAEIVLELQRMQHSQVRHYLENYPVLSAQRIAELAQQELSDEPPGTATIPGRFKRVTHPEVLASNPALRTALRDVVLGDLMATLEQKNAEIVALKEEVSQLREALQRITTTAATTTTTTDGDT
ncbi:RasGEF domain containing protein [Acanthamoeba castellanii str. Neff]|uniref:RasGEF domain containing protein n=1 Tax=Acanthamoeba castellanii (strain ATCC 30010 / Neff) TaxID=1257118 RepID=L8GMV9_ACACF|nr:RasGEF domain containing protein [Acanthamoeba castellanii str. Neff]ELR14317.1 RasGEF domain containing protein [Acanthamoeba castellanii str. Neff]